MGGLPDANALIALCWPALGQRQITDAWLLTAAVRAGLKLVTFDTGITQWLASPRERERHLSVPSPPTPPG